MGAYDSEVVGWPRRTRIPPGIVRDFAIRWDRLLRYSFIPGARVNDGLVIRARRENGFAYECVSDGQLSIREPVWPTEAGKTVRCGTVDLRCIGPNGGTDVIVQSAWTTDFPSRVSFQGDAIVGLVTAVFLSTTIAIGDEFRVFNDITCESGRLERRSFRVLVSEE